VAGYSAKALRGRTQRNTVAVGQNELRAMGGKCLGARESDSAAGTGDQDSRRALSVCHVPAHI
jgi:hypothetical protein